MTEGTRPETRRPEQSLTVPARALSEGKSGFNVDGYRDYRGVPTVGAWTWLEEAGFGVVAEVNRAEAYRPVYFIRSVFWGDALIALTSLAIFVFTILMERLKRAARKRLLTHSAWASTRWRRSLEPEAWASSIGRVTRCFAGPRP